LVKIEKMRTEEIKSKLHESIENIDDNEFLLVVKELIDRKYSPLDYPKLSKIQHDRILESDKQIDNGDYFTNNQVDKIIEKWLEE